MIETGLSQFLKSHPVVGPLLVDADLTRIFPLIIPEHVRGEARKQPCIVYQRINTYRSGTFCATDSLANVDMQMDCYAKSYVDVKNLAKKLRESLVDYTGLMGTVQVDKVFISVEFDLVETDTGLFRVSQTYSIWFQDV